MTNPKEIRAEIASEFRSKRFDSIQDAVNYKNRIFELISNECMEAVRNLLVSANEDKFRKIRIFNNIKVLGPSAATVVSDDMREQKYRLDFVISPADMTSIYYLCMNTTGEPSLLSSWLALCAVYDENLEPLSPLSANGFKNIFTE